MLMKGQQYQPPPLIAPDRIPEISWRWKAKKTISNGIVANMLPANISE
jgi:hypothetical protein